MLEQEYKALLTKPVYEQLLGLFEWDSEIDQDNYYYCDEEGITIQKGITVRIRKIGEQFSLQLKVPVQINDGLHVKEEYSFPMQEAPDCLSHPQINKILGNSYTCLKRLGVLHTNRCQLHLDQDVLLCLDQNKYLDVEDYELEVEYRQEPDPHLFALLDSYGIRFNRPVHGKFSRFLMSWHSLQEQGGNERIKL